MRFSSLPQLPVLYQVSGTSRPTRAARRKQTSTYYVDAHAITVIINGLRVKPNLIIVTIFPLSSDLSALCRRVPLFQKNHSSDFNTRFTDIDYVPFFL